MNRIVGLSLFFFGSLSGLAQDLETDRPDQTESSAVVPKGMFQIEAGVGVEIQNTDPSSNNKVQTLTLPTTLFRIAMGSRIELRVVNTLLAERHYNPFSDTKRNLVVDALQLGFKGQILTGDGLKPQLAIMSHVVLPTGSVVSNEFGAVTKILVSHDFKNGWGLGYNLGYDFEGKNASSYTYSLALNIPITAKIGGYLEAYGQYSESGLLTSNADAGFTYLLTENMQFDYSFGLGLNHRMNYQAVGLSIRFSK